MTFRQYREPTRPRKMLLNHNLEKTLQPFQEALVYNREEYNRRVQAYQLLLKAALDIYGADDSVIRYLQKHPPEPPPNLFKDMKWMKARYEEVQAAEEKRQREAEYRKDYTRRRTEATARLVEHGYTEGVDFWESTAISFERNLIAEHGELVVKTTA